MPWGGAPTTGAAIEMWLVHGATCCTELTDDLSSCNLRAPLLITSGLGFLFSFSFLFLFSSLCTDRKRGVSLFPDVSARMCGLALSWQSPPDAISLMSSKRLMVVIEAIPVLPLVIGTRVLAEVL